MRKVFVAALTGSVSVATMVGLGTASAMTADLTLVVDGTPTTMHARADQTVAQLLSSRDVTVGPQDFVSPGLDAKVADGNQIDVTHARTLTATIDGQTKVITTTATTVGAALLAIGIDPAAANVSLPTQTQITQDGAAVTIETQKMVSLRVDGTTLFTQTTSDTVGQLLAERGVTLGDIDRVTPAVDTPLTDDMSVTVQRVQVTQQTVQAAVPFDTKTIKTSTLDKGVQKVITPGVEGKATQVWNVTLVDGVEESRAMVSQTIDAKPKTQVVQLGLGHVPAPSVDAGSAQAIAQGMLGQFGFGDDQFGCLVTLWAHESGWRVNAQNRSSGAYGIPQALPGSKMASFGADWQTNPATQIAWGLNYIKNRYGSPCAAWDHMQGSGWY